METVYDYQGLPQGAKEHTQEGIMIALPLVISWLVTLGAYKGLTTYQERSGKTLDPVVYGCPSNDKLSYLIVIGCRKGPMPSLSQIGLK